MINVEYEIFRLMSKASNNKLTLTNAIGNGLAAYTADNGLDSIMERLPSERRLYYLELFLQPVLTMQPADMALYFETYTLRRDFARTANRIHNESDKKWKDGQYVCNDLEELSTEFNTFVVEISKYPTFCNRVASTVSDCSVELEYLAGRTKNISLRMSRALYELGPIQE